jgi:hypothetical protein
VEDAREAGLDVTFDGYPYAIQLDAAQHRDPAVGVRRRPPRASPEPRRSARRARG